MHEYRYRLLRELHYTVEELRWFRSRKEKEGGDPEFEFLYEGEEERLYRRIKKLIHRLGRAGLEVKLQLE